ncbi:MAG: DoxX family protein [Deltaproteobacteria bacterium]|nr:DoxX family protein [Deltaproteobacteria bacterium]
MTKLCERFQPSPTTRCASLGLLALRLVAGVAFVHHGWGKIQDPFHWMGPDAAIPGFFQALAAVSEFGGGLAWVVGLLVPLASFGVACTMGVAVWTHLIVRGDPFVGKGASYELALLYFCVALLLLLGGPGKLSVDRLVFGERK